MNTSVLLTLNRWGAAHPTLVRFFAQDAIALVALGLLVLVVLQVRREAVIAVLPVAAVLGSAFLLGLLAAAVHSERRPFQDHHLHQLIAHDPGQSFPSDHATAAFACALAALLLLSRVWGLVLLALATAIGVARVAAGVHYPSDVLGSLLVAALGGLLGLLTRRLLENRAARLPG